MTITCTTPGAWDAVLGANAYLSKQQWQAAFLFVLCQMKAVVNGESTMSPCSVAGVWDAIQGNGYVTDQEFYKESLNTLCSIATVLGGGSSGAPVVGLTQAAAPPPVDGSVTTLFYRNTLTGQKFMNTGTVAVPAWEAV